MAVNVANLRPSAVTDAAADSYWVLDHEDLDGVCGTYEMHDNSLETVRLPFCCLQPYVTDSGGPWSSSYYIDFDSTSGLSLQAAVLMSNVTISARGEERRTLLVSNRLFRQLGQSLMLSWSPLPHAPHVLSRSSIF